MNSLQTDHPQGQAELAKSSPVNATIREAARDNRDCYGLVIEASPDEAEIDIVAVHGLGGDRRQTWTLEGNPDMCWISQAFPRARIMLYGYETSEETSSCFTRRGIFDEAARFLELFQGLNVENRRPIMFVSHGIGGSLVKAALVLATQDMPKFSKLVMRVRVLIFFGCPHRSVDIDEMREQILKHVYQLQSSAKLHGSILPLVNSLTETVNDVNGLFIHTKMLIQTHLINVFCSCPSEQVFAKSTVLMHTPLEQKIESQTPHSTMTRLDPQMVNKFRSLKTEDWLAGSLNEYQEKVLHDLLSQASPIYPYSDSNVLDLSPSLPAVLDNLLAAHTQRVLHIQCDANSVLLSQSVYSYLTSRDDTKIFYFHFDPCDIRFNNMAAMLRTFLCQLSYNAIRSLSWNISRVLAYGEALHAWNTEDFITQWERFFLRGSFDCLVYIIGGLDRCDSSSEHFLSMLKSIFTTTEWRFRAVITTTTGVDGQIFSELSKLPIESYQKLIVQRITCQDPRAECQRACKLPVLFQEHSRYLSSGLGATIASTLAACGGDDELRLIILEWLAWNHHEPLQEIEERLMALKGQMTAELVFDAILSGIPPQRHHWARVILSWVYVSVRPLQVEELCLISGTVIEGGTPDSIKNMTYWFQGLLKIRHNEVHFGHSRIRDWIESQMSTSETPRKWWHYERVGDQHMEVLKICLALLLAPVQPQQNATPCYFSYIYQYWAVHYKRAQSVGGEAFAWAKDRATSLLRDEATRQRWVNAYLSLVDPFARPGQGFAKPLAIAAHFGLDDLVEVFRGESNDEDEQCALTEAARQGHITTVCTFLPPLAKRLHRLDDPHLEQLVKAAMSCDNQNVLCEVIKHLAKENPDLNKKHAWLSDVILKACWLRNEKLMETALDLGADLHASLPKENFPRPIGPVELAARHNAIGVIKAFLKRNIRIDPDSGIANKSLIEILALHGSAELVRLFLANGFSPEMKDDRNHTILQYACSWGKFAVVDVLLEHDGLRFEDYINADTPQPLVLAAVFTNYKVIEILINHGAQINAHDKYGNALYYAIKENRIDICHLLLDKGIDVNFTSVGSVPPLVIAANPNVDVDILELLLDKDVDIEKKGPSSGENNAWGRTALLQASACNKPEKLRLLLDRHASTSVRDSDQWTPLYTAAISGLTENVKLLVDQGADIYATCSDQNWTPLHAAYDKPDILRILLDRGANSTKAYGAKINTLELAALYNSLASVKLMVNQLEPDENRDSMGAALLAAVKNENEEIARYLLEAGANVNHVTSDKASLVSLALARESETMVRTLLEYRPDLKVTDINDNTILHYITAATKVPSIRLAIIAGAELDSLNKWQESPLTMAIETLNEEACRYLLSKKPALLTLNIPGRSGTPLHRACRMSTLDTVRLLVQNGADYNLSCKGLIGTPLMEFCIRHDDDDGDTEKEAIVRYLLEECHTTAKSPQDVFSSIHVASLACSAAVVKLLANHGADPSIADHIGRKPIHLACYNSFDVVMSVEVSEQDYTIRDKVGRLPLHYAVLSGQPDLVEKVLEKTKRAGFGVDEKDNDGWTPLLWAARATKVYGWREKHDIHADEIIRLLLDNGADCQVQGRDYQSSEWSASDIAVYHGAMDAAKTLETHIKDLNLPPRGPAKGKKRGMEDEGRFCDGCLLDLFGVYFNCQECGFDLCFKCYASKDALHPSHDFMQRGLDNEVHSSRASSPVNAGHMFVHETEDSEDDFDEVISDVGDEGAAMDSGSNGS